MLCAQCTPTLGSESCGCICGGCDVHGYNTDTQLGATTPPPTTTTTPPPSTPPPPTTPPHTPQLPATPTHCKHDWVDDCRYAPPRCLAAWCTMPGCGAHLTCTCRLLRSSRATVTHHPPPPPFPPPPPPPPTPPTPTSHPPQPDPEPPEETCPCCGRELDWACINEPPTCDAVSCADWWCVPPSRHCCWGRAGFASRGSRGDRDNDGWLIEALLLTRGHPEWPGPSRSRTYELCWCSTIPRLAACRAAAYCRLQWRMRAALTIAMGGTFDGSRTAHACTWHTQPYTTSGCRNRS